MKRLYNLDYLRGLAALGIFFYHYRSWSICKFSADTFIGRIEGYGVSVFYVLGGLTLFCGYNLTETKSDSDAIDFFKKRFLILNNFNKNFFYFHVLLHLVISFVVTLIISFYSSNYFEKFFIRIGKLKTI